MAMDDQDSLFERLYVKHYDELYKAAYYQLKNYDDAQDTVQETFLVAATKKEQFLVHPNKIGWLYKILGFCIKRRYGENTYRTSKKDEEGVSETVVNRVSFVEYDNNVSEAALAYNDNYFEQHPFDEYREILTEKEFNLIIHKFYDGFSVQEIADKLNMSYSNTTSVTSLIYKKIKKFMGQT